MFASWQEVNFLELFRRGGFIPPLPKRTPEKYGGRPIINLVSAFDIETSRIDLEIPDGETQNSHSFMYVWQYQIEEITVMGRTWEEFFSMLENITSAITEYQNEQKLEVRPVMVCFAHNLAYEFCWLAGLYPFKNEEVFFRQPRKPLYCRMFDSIEFRCSYMQTNMTLLHLTKLLGVEQKLSGDEFDYNKMRFPWTELTDYELEYCVRDVRSLVKCMKIRMEKDGDNLQTIPLTSTGYVRRDCKQAIKPLYRQIQEIKPNVRIYQLLRSAFRGGNTHGNRKHIGKILDNVSSYDMTSCYPAQQLTKKFPMGKFKFLDDRISLERVFKFIGLGYAVIALYGFKNIRLKPGITIPYLSLSRTKSFGFVGGIDNGRILYADRCITVLTEIDLSIVLEQYDFDSLHIMSVMVARKDYLPDEYRKVIRNYYDNKTYLKGASDYEEVYRYNKSKELLNSVFGMSCQDPIHSTINYDGGKYTEVNLYDFPDKAEEALQKAPFPYQWGVYVCCYARRSLQDAINLAGERMVYCDTDSVKVLGELDLTDINQKREKTARTHKAYAKDRKGIPHYMGVFEFEGTYDKFITQGAKRYAYIKNGKMGVTVSGVSKKINPATGVPIACEELRSLDRFREGMVWRESAGTMSVYNDNDDFWYTDQASGKSVHVTPNVAILPTTYKMGYSRDYRELLTDVLKYGDYVDKRR